MSGVDAIVDSSSKKKQNSPRDFADVILFLHIVSRDSIDESDVNLIKAWDAVHDKKSTLSYTQLRDDYLIPAKTEFNPEGKSLVDLIAQYEAAGDFDNVYGGKSKIDLDGDGKKETQVYIKGEGVMFNGKRMLFTDMRIDQVLEWQKKYTTTFNSASSAVGGPQFIRKTLQGLLNEAKRPEGLRLIDDEDGKPVYLRLTGSEKFDENMQRQLAEALLVRRGYNDFIKGRINTAKFMDNIAYEWASFVGSNGKGKYDNDGLNKGYAEGQKIKTVLQNTFDTANAGVLPSANNKTDPKNEKSLTLG